MIFPPRSTMLTLVVLAMVTAPGPKIQNSARFSVLMESTTVAPTPLSATLLTLVRFLSSRRRLTLNSPGHFGRSPNKDPITTSFLVTDTPLLVGTFLLVSLLSSPLECLNGTPITFRDSTTKIFRKEFGFTMWLLKLAQN